MAQDFALFSIQITMTNLKEKTFINRLSAVVKIFPISSVHSLFDFNEHEESFFLDAIVKIAYRQ